MTKGETLTRAWARADLIVLVPRVRQTAISDGTPTQDPGLSNRWD